jgi:hypothetical protein
VIKIDPANFRKLLREVIKISPQAIITKRMKELGNKTVASIVSQPQLLKLNRVQVSFVNASTKGDA